MTEKINILKDIINDRGKKVIVSHMNPDGDAIGSSSALCRVLQNKGQEPFVISPNMIPDYLNFLTCETTLHVYEFEKELCNKALLEADYIFCLDFNELRRTSATADFIRKSKAKKILIDHHPSPSEEFDYYYSYPGLSSASELVFKLLKESGELTFFDKKAAAAIYSGILTDTGSFCHSNVKPDTFSTAAELLKYDFDREKVYVNIYNSFSESRMNLLGKLLKDKMTIFPEFYSAYILLDKETQDEYNFKAGDSEGFVNYPLSIKDVIFTLLISERDGKLRLSFRSQGDFPANEIASKYFKGGGHLNAAGGESSNSIDETIETFKKVITEYKEKLKNTYEALYS